MIRRVLMVTPFPPKRDGLATYAQDLAELLSGHVEIRVATQTMSRANTAPDVMPILSASPWSARRLSRIISEFRPDVVHIQFTVPAFGIQALWLLLGIAHARRHSGVRTVWTLHEVVREIALLRSLGRIFYRSIARLCDVCVVLSPESRRSLIENGVAPTDPNWIVVVPHGVPERLRSGRDDEDVRRDGPLVYFGYLHTDKGVEHLIDAVGRLRRKHGSDIELVVAGAVRPRQGVFKIFEGRDRRYAGLLHRAAGHGVTFAGYLDDEELDALLCSATLVVFPYTSVTQSGAVNRAIALGCPVVASDLPGLREDVPHPSGLVPAADPAALASTVMSLLNDPARRAEMAAAAAAAAAERSGQARVRQTLDAYRQAVEAVRE